MREPTRGLTLDVEGRLMRITVSEDNTTWVLYVHKTYYACPASGNLNLLIQPNRKFPD